MQLGYPQRLVRRLPAAGVFLLAAIALGAVALGVAWGSRGVTPAPGGKSNKLAEATARPVKIVGASSHAGCANAWPYFENGCRQDPKQENTQQNTQENAKADTKAPTPAPDSANVAAISISHTAVDRALNFVADTPPISTDGVASAQDAALAARIAPIDVQQNAAIRPDMFPDTNEAIANGDGARAEMPVKRRRHGGRRHRHHHGVFLFGF